MVSRPPTPIGRALSIITDLFLACRLMMTATVAMLALIGAADPDQQSTQAHREVLRAAATCAGLDPAGTIIAGSRPGHGDRFVFYADDEQALTALTASTADGSARPVRIDLFTATPVDVRHD